VGVVTVNLPPLIRVQSVKPELPSGHIYALAAIYVLFVNPVLAMLALHSAHELWAGVPAAGYWQCFFLVRGLAILKGRPHRGWGR
jgi:hypothetical protein